MTGGRIEVGDPPKVLFDDAEIWLERGEHVSLIGPNRLDPSEDLHGASTRGV